jgi:hypothetical protein
MTIRSFIRSSVLSLVLVASGCTAHVVPPTPVPPVCASPSCSHAQFSVSVSPAGAAVSIRPDLFPEVGGVQVTPGRYSIIVPGEDQGTGASLIVTAPGYVPYSVRSAASAGGGVLRGLPGCGA